MLQKTFQKLINSPIPLLLLGGTSLFLYLSLGFLARSLLNGEIDSFLDRFPGWGNIIIYFSYLLFLFFSLTLIWAVKKSKLAPIPSSSWIIAIVYFLLFSIVLMTTPPLTSQDVFWNLFQGRIFIHYQENPYLVAPQNFPEDPFLKNIRIWQDFPMTHGPLWTFIVSLPQILSPNNLFLQIIILRTFLFASLGLLIIFLTLFLRQFDPSWQFPAFIALAWNPLLLIETINNAHNDILVGFTAILGLFFISRSRYFKGFVVLWIGVLVKYVTVLLIPLGILFALRHNLRDILKVGPKITVAIILLTLIAYLPFGYNIYQFQGPKYQNQIFEYTVLPPVPFLLATIGGVINRAVFKEVVGQDRQIPLFAFQNGRILDILVMLIRVLSIIIFLILYLWLLFKPFRDERDLFQKGFLIFLVYLLVPPFWFMAWYLVWLIPLAVIGGLGTTLVVLGLSLIAFPYPFPIFQVITLSVGFGVVILLVIKKLMIRKSKKEFIQEC